MCSSDVMLRINSSESSGLSAGPSTRCKMPCTRMVGGTPTRICRSDAPSATTNCNKSDIEYDIKIQMQIAECRMQKLAPPVESGFNSSFFILPFHYDSSPSVERMTSSATTNCNKSDIEYDIKIQMQIAECRMQKLAPPVESGFNFYDILDV